MEGLGLLGNQGLNLRLLGARAEEHPT
ncbi:hypothetical protein BN873_530003 [Candidatus Competibacter denitrificans Run_A_D11]|uniref:Uncharacterized protein n=1 Tax=Candidatus Competibacter denitrificans Run_A_D11 TaxID=1400863 RepID=W6MA19_9GAMM|nr:hypothetical protein BN873_530003 [Candidatus Competibacter denitrificans Run_A_D11]